MKQMLLFFLYIIIVLHYVNKSFSISFNKKVIPINTRQKQQQIKRNSIRSIHQPTTLPSPLPSTANEQQQRNESVSSGRNKLKKIVLSALIFSIIVTQKPLPVMAITTPIPSSLFLSLSLSILPSVFLTCTLPTLLGFFKNKYIWSYGYGLAIFFTALLKLTTIKTASSLPTVQLVHTLALLCYGIRLSLFLLYREITIPRFREFTDNIETHASSNKLKRVPFMIMCGILYMCICAPLFAGPLVATTSTTRVVLQGLVGMTWFGFLLNVIGDITKSFIKFQKGNADELVTSGIFRYFRHPNYTGDQIAWTGNFLLSIAIVACNASASAVSSNSSYMIVSIVKKVLMDKIVWASFFGWVGIEFVLISATKALESRQKAKYGEMENYEAWIKKSWVGFC